MRCVRLVCVAAIGLVLVAPALAETQDIKIGGDLQIRAFYANEKHDLGADYDPVKRAADLNRRATRIANELTGWLGVPSFCAQAVPRWDGTTLLRSQLLNPYGLTTLTAVQAYLSGPAQHRDNDESWFDSTVRLYADVDLTDNVAVFVRLLNERDWDGTQNANSNADVVVDLAYMTMSDFFGYPLEMKLGRQEITVGEGFLIGDGFGHNTDLAWALATNPATGETLYYAKSTGAFARAMSGGGDVTAISYGESARKAFDALRFTYTEDPVTVDVFGAKLIEGATAASDDRDIFGISTQYDYYDYGEFGIGLFCENAAMSRQVYALSLRGKTEIPGVDGLVVKGEVVPEWGQTGRFDVNGDGADESVDQGGIGGYLGLWYFFENELSPYVGVDYVYLSGDDDPTDDDVKEFYPFAEDESYGEINETAWWGLDTNLEIWNIGLGLKPTENTSVAVDYYDFTVNEPKGLGVLTDGKTLVIPFNISDDDFGKELDMTVSYDYTEDVQFGLALAWFDPGKVVQKLVGDDKTATQVVGSVKVTF